MNEYIGFRKGGREGGGGGGDWEGSTKESLNSKYTQKQKQKQPKQHNHCNTTTTTTKQQQQQQTTVAIQQLQYYNENLPLYNNPDDVSTTPGSNFLAANHFKSSGRVDAETATLLLFVLANNQNKGNNKIIIIL
jgi:hypothetical protein